MAPRARADRYARGALPTLALEWPEGPDPEVVAHLEWLVTNGVGGYASGTIARCNTRRYHGLLVANLPALGRTVVLPRLVEEAQVEGQHFRLDGDALADGPCRLAGASHLRGFRLVGLLPEWDFQLGPARVRRSLVMVHGENTVFVAYEHLGGPDVMLRLRPFPRFRGMDQALTEETELPAVWLQGDRLEVHVSQQALPLRMRLHYAGCRTPFVSSTVESPRLLYGLERSRGYAFTERQLSPGYFECCLMAGRTLALAVSTEGWSSLDLDPLVAFTQERQREDRLLDRAPLEARTGHLGRLVLAADQFVIEPVGRPVDISWARATGQSARTVIAGYHWFGDWGRDTMISLEGLTLCTGRFEEAAAILRTFEHYVRDGLIPNRFLEGNQEALYNTADATLWFFHALDRYTVLSGDEELLWDLLPTLEAILEHHLRGTRFGIGVDPSDGLLRQGDPERPLTWMDARVGDWVVTPRRGKAVEINGLWFNALRLMADFCARFGEDGTRWLRQAERVKRSFNARFWNAAEQCLYDVVDGEAGDDPAVRPNQLLSFSLRHPVLRAESWAPVLQRVRQELLTPRGLRTLSPKHPDYQPRYDGDVRARDAAYHQGTVWPWLLGPYSDAWFRVHGHHPDAWRLFQGVDASLDEHCVGQVSEICDAVPPFHPRGCVAQAWSVAEALRGSLRLAREAAAPGLPCTCAEAARPG